jgi:hypothetical protein
MIVHNTQYSNNGVAFIFKQPTHMRVVCYVDMDSMPILVTKPEPLSRSLEAQRQAQLAISKLPLPLARH